MLIFLKLSFLNFVIFMRPVLIGAENGTTDEQIKQDNETNGAILGKYAVSLRRYPEETFGANHFCGGTIIRPRIVLTAAQCLFMRGREIKPEDLIVVAGCVYRSKKDNKTQTRRISHFMLHPFYQPGKNLANIAVVILVKGFREDGLRVQRVKMITKPTKVGTNCTELGWGRKHEGEPRSNKILYVNLTIVSKTVCDKLQNKTKMLPNDICLVDKTGKNQSDCDGDSGGPVICNGSTLVGIVTSSANSCDTEKKKKPNFCTNVHYFVDWIRDVQNAILKNSCIMRKSFIPLVLCGVLLHIFNEF